MSETQSQPGLSELLPEGLDKPADVPAEIFDAALGTFLAGQRLDMRGLAEQLGIGRATLYRRVRDRNHLLSEIIWWLTRHLIARAVQASARKRSPHTRVLAVIESLLRDVSASAPLRRFLDEEPEAALRILTSKQGRVQSGLVEALTRLIASEQPASARQGIEPATLAYVIVRIAEGFLYADVIADAEPDIDQAMEVVDRLLRAA